MRGPGAAPLVGCGAKPQHPAQSRSATARGKELPINSEAISAPRRNRGLSFPLNRMCVLLPEGFPVALWTSSVHSFEGALSRSFLVSIRINIIGSALRRGSGATAKPPRTWEGKRFKGEINFYRLIKRTSPFANSALLRAVALRDCAGVGASPHTLPGAPPLDPARGLRPVGLRPLTHLFA